MHVQKIAQELKLAPAAVASTIELLAENTVPFIARYRKEATGGLDEVEIRAIEERKTTLDDLESRRATVLSSIEEQGKLTPELKQAILACARKTDLEDLYLPYKPKRRTRAMIAREKGLQPLADRIMEQPDAGDPQVEALAFLSEEHEVPDAETALALARDIVSETLSESAEIRALVRKALIDQALLKSQVTKEFADKRTKFEDYYDYSEPASRLPPHRVLALMRGEREGVLKTKFELDKDTLADHVAGASGMRKSSPFAGQMHEAVVDGLKRLLLKSLENEYLGELKTWADRDAVEVFAKNLRNLLLAACFGQHSVVGVDPGLRTGCKVAAVDATGTYRATITVYPHSGEGRAESAKRELRVFLERHQPDAIAIGDGTAGRETLAFVNEVLKDMGNSEAFAVLVSEAGASVYSASDIAREEFPDLDLTIRGAISIARRLQDPLAELVKLDPKAIGVGQYQHDVNQKLLADKLEEVIESCVNLVGVEVNTASAKLLEHVAGIGPAIAKNIVAMRESEGPFDSRKALLKVPKLGKRTFEQAAGFLRVKGGKHPLDASAVHPERYALVEQMAKDLGAPLAQLVGAQDRVAQLDLQRYVSGDVGLPTLNDILAELKKPGRDPRESFEPPKFREDITEIHHLKEGMILEGVATNVTNFGCFVDVGVHQDGLVHISELDTRFVRDPAEVVGVGDRFKVRVLSVDLERKRISLSRKQAMAGSELSEVSREGRQQAPRERNDPARGNQGRGGEQGRGEQGRGGQGRGGQGCGEQGRGGQGRGGQGRGGNQGRVGGQGRGGQASEDKFTNNPFGKLKR